MPAFVVDAVRLAAVETLAPTAALQGLPGAAFPTIAGGHVFDSRMLMVEDFGSGSRRTPALGVYTESVRAEPRGNAQFSAPAVFMVDLVVEAEISILDRDEHGVPGVGPAPTDAAAELELGFLLAQTRRALTMSVGGGVLHRIVKQITDIESVPRRIPGFGIRLAGRTLRLRCAVDDDTWSAAGGLPEPLKTVRARLPTGSYAAAQLDRIAAAIAADPARVPLEEIRMTLVGLDGSEE